MSQQSVSDFLKENKYQWFTVEEIAKELKLSISTITNNCKRLRGRQDINIIFTRPLLYRYKEWQKDARDADIKIIMLVVRNVITENTEEMVIPIIKYVNVIIVK